MQQRRVRLGDILDDYCPRERRITNHAVVAMIDDEVKQTRCTTCDAEHEYKQAKVPAQRRKKLEAGNTDSAEGLLRPRPLPEETAGGESEEFNGGTPEIEVESAVVTEPLSAPEPLQAAESEPSQETEDVGASSDDEGPVHRRLIRATLPRPDGQTPERRAPDFTIHQPGRGRDFDRNGHRHGRRQARAHGGSQSPRFGGPRQGQGGSRSGSGQGQRPPGNRPGHPGGSRGNRPGGGGRGGRKRGR